MHHYVVVRLDVPLGVRVAQTIHAAGVSARLVEELPDDTHAVALGALGEEQLLRLEAKLKFAGIAYAAIREPDEPYCGQLLAIGLAPVPKHLVRRFMGSLPLIK